MPDEIGPVQVPQPFWTSKGFWTAAVTFGLAVAVKAGWLDASFDLILWSGMILGVLSGIFRWVSDQPLTLTGGTKF